MVCDFMYNWSICNWLSIELILLLSNFKLKFEFYFLQIGQGHSGPWTMW